MKITIKLNKDEKTSTIKINKKNKEFITFMNRLTEIITIFILTKETKNNMFYSINCDINATAVIMRETENIFREVN